MRLPVCCRSMRASQTKDVSCKPTRATHILPYCCCCHLQIELQYGLMYDKYRYSCYYWETILLIENCSLTLLLVLLQGEPPALQVMCAMAVIFIEAVLHVSDDSAMLACGRLSFFCSGWCTSCRCCWVEQCCQDMSLCNLGVPLSCNRRCLYPAHAPATD
jgi:hypothetical protein